MPSIVERPVTIAEADTPELGYFGLAVDDEGLIAYIASMRDAPMIKVIDSTGALHAAFGRQGDGPGEFRTPTQVAWFHDTLSIRSRAGVMARFTSSGKFVEEDRTSFFGTILSVGRDSLVGVALAPSEEIPASGIVRVDISSGRGRSLPTDTFVTRLLRAATGQGSSFIPFAERGQTTLVGDGLGYSIRMYDDSGQVTGVIHRNLPVRTRGARELELRRESLRRSLRFRGPNGERMDEREIDRQLEAAATEAVPYFDRGSLFFDGNGRLWVFGIDQDSTVADVFSGTTHLGRIVIGCFNRWGWRSLSGAWLVMGCETDPDTDVPNLQLYRIVG